MWCAGVADGVSGSAREADGDSKEVCPGVFARALMNGVDKATREVQQSPTAPADCLSMAHKGLGNLEVGPSPLPACACAMLSVQCSKEQLCVKQSLQVPGLW